MYRQLFLAAVEIVDKIMRRYRNIDADHMVKEVTDVPGFSVACKKIPRGCRGIFVNHFVYFACLNLPSQRLQNFFF